MAARQLPTDARHRPDTLTIPQFCAKNRPQRSLPLRLRKEIQEVLRTPLSAATRGLHRRLTYHMPRIADQTPQNHWGCRRCCQRGFRYALFWSASRLRAAPRMTYAMTEPSLGFPWRPPLISVGQPSGAAPPAGTAWLSGGHPATTGTLHTLAARDLPALRCGGRPGPAGQSEVCTA